MSIKNWPGGRISSIPPTPTQATASGVWTLDQQAYWQSIGQWPTPSYKIQRSLRFNSADSAFLNRTPASASNRKTWTWSGWVKRASLDTGLPQQLFTARNGSGTPGTWVGFMGASNGNVLRFEDSNGADLRTTPTYRDASAWYHIVVACDTTQATASNRVRIYVNGVEVTAFSTSTYPTQNTDTTINSTFEHRIGAQPVFGDHFNGYMTEVNFIDGQALTPSSFGAFDAQTGVWGPTRYAGSYGTNGFYLNFSDNSNTTAATLGRDYSGNGNNWTPNNFSVSAGAGNDSLVDVPTNWGVDTGVGGSVRGNYCTLNPLYGNPAPTNGNLDVTVNNTTVYGSLSFTSGKWYWEVTPTVVGGILYIGVMNSAYIKTDGAWGATTARTYVSNGTTFGSNGGTYGASYTTNDIIGIALDMDAGSITFYKNGASQGTAFTNLGGNEWRPLVYASETSTLVCNFGQRPFAYTAPSGFRALNTQNLPTPTIGATTATQAGKYFNPVLWTANGGVQTVTGVGFSPEFLWIKDRQAANSHTLHNIVVGSTRYLESNTTSAEITSANYVTSIDSDGWSIGTSNYTNGRQLVSWCWRANGAGVTNTAGSITSTVSANTTSGFSIVTYTGNSTNGATVGHGLGVSPVFVIVKSRNDTFDWIVWSRSFATNNTTAFLNTTDAAGAYGVWSSTLPSSTVITLPSSGYVNGSTKTYVAYCFAEVPGYSRFGSYTGNGSTDGTFVYCGFRPEFVMVKGTNVTSDWWINDAERSVFNQTANNLVPNSSSAEYTGNDFNSIDILSNGFKMRNTNTSSNASGGTYIFAAFASAPQKFALAR